VWMSSEHTFDRRVTPRFIGSRSFFPFMQYLAHRNINLGAASLVRDIDATRRACRLCILHRLTHRHANVFDLLVENVKLIKKNCVDLFLFA